MPGMATTKTSVWSAPPACECIALAVSGAASVSHGQATDVVFVAAEQAETEDSAWLSGSFSVPDLVVL